MRAKRMPLSASSSFALEGHASTPARTSPTRSYRLCRYRHRPVDQVA